MDLWELRANNFRRLGPTTTEVLAVYLACSHRCSSAYTQGRFSVLPRALAEVIWETCCRRSSLRKRCREPKEARALGEQSVSSTGPLRKQFFYTLKQQTFAGYISVMAVQSDSRPFDWRASRRISSLRVRPVDGDALKLHTAPHAH